MIHQMKIDGWRVLMSKLIRLHPGVGERSLVAEGETGYRDEWMPSQYAGRSPDDARWCEIRILWWLINTGTSALTVGVEGWNKRHDEAGPSPLWLR